MILFVQMGMQFGKVWIFSGFAFGKNITRSNMLVVPLISGLTAKKKNSNLFKKRERIKYTVGYERLISCMKFHLNYFLVLIQQIELQIMLLTTTFGKIESWKCLHELYMSV